MIETYTFGQMTINGKSFHNDLILLPDGSIYHPWWRKNGHQLVLSDLEAIAEQDLNVLVVGTGNSGMMKPHPGLAQELQARGVEVIVQPTQQAVETYNKFKAASAMVAGCFHLTC